MDDGSKRFVAAGVLLAAGAGTRLGRGPKALLRKADGETLLESARRALPAGGCTHVVVLGAEAGRLSPALEKDANTTVLLNAHWATGMASSLAQGMAAVPEGSAALVALVDQPGPSAELVRRILDAHCPGRIAAAGYRSGDAPLRRGHPVLFAAEHLGPAAAASTGDAGARGYLGANREVVDLVDCTGLDTGLDIDTVADLHLLDRHWRRDLARDYRCQANVVAAEGHPGEVDTRGIDEQFLKVRPAQRPGDDSPDAAAAGSQAQQHARIGGLHALQGADSARRWPSCPACLVLDAGVEPRPQCEGFVAVEPALGHAFDRHQA